MGEKSLIFIGLMINQSDGRAKAIYYDWEKVRRIDPFAQPPRFLSNTGQWFGTAE
jgi:hypothetical protein